MNSNPRWPLLPVPVGWSGCVIWLTPTGWSGVSPFPPVSSHELLQAHFNNFNKVSLTTQFLHNTHTPTHAHKSILIIQSRGLNCDTYLRSEVIMWCMWDPTAEQTGVGKSNGSLKNQAKALWRIPCWNCRGPYLRLKLARSEYETCGRRLSEIIRLFQQLPQLTWHSTVACHEAVSSARKVRGKVLFSLQKCTVLIM